jgi:hypothetical protein
MIAEDLSANLIATALFGLEWYECARVSPLRG